MTVNMFKTGIISLLFISTAAFSQISNKTEFDQALKNAQSGDAKAQFEVGKCYYNGIGGKKNSALGISSNSEDIAKDPAEAAKWFRKAADQGHGGAQYFLGLCFTNGEGVVKDPAEALKWYKKAAENGVAEAQQAIKKLSDSEGTKTNQEYSSAQPSKDQTIDLGNNISLKLVLIPAGKFMMGSPRDDKGHSTNEEPYHEVTISKPFYMGIYEVTQDQYERIMGKNPSHFKGATNPVENVTMEDALGFCKKLSTGTGRLIRLPTEAEWEYACRAGSKTSFCFGDEYDTLGDYSWHEKNSDQKTHPVGQKKANAWGLYDMHGNVWEYCSDWFADSYAKAKNIDPQGPDSGSQHVMRGCGWFGGMHGCRSAYRNSTPPNSRNSYLGFRIVMTQSANAQPARKPEQAPVAQPVAKDHSNPWDAFKGIPWGARLSDLKKEKGWSPGMKTKKENELWYTRDSDSVKLGTIDIDPPQYCFYKDQFGCAVIYCGKDTRDTDPPKFKLVCAILTEKYGQYSDVKNSDESLDVEWEGKNSKNENVSILLRLYSDGGIFIHWFFDPIMGQQYQDENKTKKDSVKKGVKDL